MKNKSSKKINFSLMIGVSGSTPAPLSPLKPDKPTANTEAQGKVTVKPLKPNGCGE